MTDNGPDDPIGTVRAGVRTLAVRARSVADSGRDALSWFVIDISENGDGLPTVESWDDVAHQIHDWPIVHQP